MLIWFSVLLHRPYQGFFGQEKLVFIRPGYSLPQIAETLESHGVITSARLFKAYARLGLLNASLRAGEYRFHRPASIVEVAEKLRHGHIHHHRIMVPEGLTMNEITAQLVSKDFGRRDRYQTALRATQVISNLDPLAKNLEGYLFPETYFLTRGMSAREIVELMVTHFKRIWTSDRDQRAAKLGLSPREVVTLASLIEKEAARDEERQLISAVFHNRLRRNFKLSCDPTVVYAVKLVQEHDGIIHQSDLNFNSPYNTYLYPGLPPGPIANPGLKSIDAALYPASVDYLYFVSKNDGSHLFSSTYIDHSRAVSKYQR